MRKKRVDEVFGVSNTVLGDSYVDRGELDSELRKHLNRKTHIALRGESKCGKSWIRQENIPDALVVQCRLGKGVLDLYIDALSQLEIRLTIEAGSEHKLKGRVEAQGSVGTSILAKLSLRGSIEEETGNSDTQQLIGHDVNDLRFVADILKESDRRLVVEDFHYMSVSERQRFAFDLKTLWDYGLFVVVIGVWSQSNMLLYLNPDLSGRMYEIPIYWSGKDLAKVLSNGGRALNIDFSRSFTDKAIENSFGNVGILQTLALRTLDALQIDSAASMTRTVDDIQASETAAMEYAEQLNPLYLQFARRVSEGIRRRQSSTNIYAHAMAVILEAGDDHLIRGLTLDELFSAAYKRENRIQKGNLRAVLEKFEALQVDADGRGLVIAYNEANSEVSVVDRQLLLYRRYITVNWPWEDVIAGKQS